MLAVKSDIDIIKLSTAPLLKGIGQSPNHKDFIFLSPALLFIHVDSFGVSCSVLETSAEEMSAFSAR